METLLPALRASPGFCSDVVRTCPLLCPLGFVVRICRGQQGCAATFQWHFCGCAATDCDTDQLVNLLNPFIPHLATPHPPLCRPLQVWERSGMLRQVRGEGHYVVCLAPKLPAARASSGRQQHSPGWPTSSLPCSRDPIKCCPACGDLSFRLPLCFAMQLPSRLVANHPGCFPRNVGTHVCALLQ